MLIPNSPASLNDLTDQVLWLVTSGDIQEPAGLIATAVLQFSISPRSVRYAVILAKSHHTCQCVLATQALTLHLLEETTLSFVERFGTRHGPDPDKFAGLQLVTSEFGGPVVIDAPAWGAGRVYRQMDLGDRIAFFVELKSENVKRQINPLTWNRFKQLAAPELLKLLSAQLEADQLRDDRILENF